MKLERRYFRRRSLATKAKNIRHLFEGAENPLPLALDSLRLMPSPYQARLRNGIRLDLLPRRGEWFTVLETVLRQDYLTNGVQLEPGDTVVDIGANIGAFAVLAARAIGPAGHVFAYEPDPETFARLRANVILNGLENVTLYNEAVGGSDGVAHLARYGKSAYNAITSSTDGRNNQQTNTVEVPVVSIKNALRRIAGGRVELIKMDCEGAEYDILRNLHQDDASAVRQVSMEVHAVAGHEKAEVRDFLSALGFIVQGGYPLTAVRLAETADAGRADG